jgi:hypothetical protein
MKLNPHGINEPRGKYPNKQWAAILKSGVPITLIRDDDYYPTLTSSMKTNLPGELREYGIHVTTRAHPDPDVDGFMLELKK